MPKVEEFYPSRASLRGPQGRTTGSNDHIYNKRCCATRRKRRTHAAQARALRERWRWVSETIILGILDHFKF